MKLSAFLALPGQSATDIARKCGVAVSTITRVSKGQKSPSLALIKSVRQATNGAVRADDFLPPFEESAVDSGAVRLPPTPENEAAPAAKRSEEHTSELQSLMRIPYAVFCLNTKTQQKSHRHTSDKYKPRQQH